MARVGPQRKPLYLFTDGSYEPDEEARLGIKAAYGAVMHDPEDECVETFGAEISEELLTLPSRGGSKRQIMGQSTHPVPRRSDRMEGPDDRQENFPVYRLRSGQVRAN